MRICFIGLEIIPRKNLSFYGGLANNVIRISKGLTKNGKHNINIITSDVNQVLPSSFPTPWGEIHPIKLWSPFTSFLFGAEFFMKASKRILREHSKSKFDVLHAHSAYPILGSISLFSSLPTSIRSVFTLYSPLSRSLGSRGWIFRQLPQWSLSKVFLSKIDHIIAISENVKSSLKAIEFPEDKIDVVPPAIDTELFNSNVSDKGIRQKLSLDQHDQLILYCGNWAPWKGVDLLVDSMRRVVKEFPNAKLVLAFGEPIKWNLESKIRIEKKIKESKLESNIMEIGFVNGVEHLMAACDVFVAPFRDTREVADIPLSILESMACGKSVIATKVGGIPEIIRHRETGLLVEPNDEIELSKAICFLLTNRETARDLGNKASRHVLQNYSINVVAQRIALIYEKLVRS
jgi:glycosyltransferase involved in cell wall biosynthesis